MYRHTAGDHQQNQTLYKTSCRAAFKISSCQSDEVEQASVKLIKDWSQSWCATSRRQHLLPVSALSVDGVMVDPVMCIRDLGIYIDANLSMRTHFQRTVSRCFAVLRQLWQNRWLIPPATFQTLVVALVLSRLDYGNGVLIGLHTYYTPQPPPRNFTTAPEIRRKKYGASREPLNNIQTSADEYFSAERHWIYARAHK